MIKWIRDRPEQKPGGPKGRSQTRPNVDNASTRSSLAPFAPWQPRAHFLPLLPSSPPLRTCLPSTAGCPAKDPMVVAFATASHAAPVLRMSVLWQTHPPACARAARGRDHRAGMPYAQAVTRPFRRVRVAHRGHQPSLFAGRARMKDAHRSASDRRSSSSAARTLFSRCIAPSVASIGSNSSATHSETARSL